MRLIYEGQDDLPLAPPCVTSRERVVHNLRRQFNALVVRNEVAKVLVAGRCGQEMSNCLAR